MSETRMKSKILQILRSENGVVSGESISESCQVSRVTVWKHIQKLQQAGYHIESTSRGHRLVESPDTPYPWEFPERESRIHYYPEIGSTMDPARELARSGCPAFTVVLADRQSSGRGRMRRVWLSDPGGLYMTVVLRPSVPPAYGIRTLFVISLTLCRLIREMTGVDARVKWPNDILVGGRKLCGMLSEMEAEDDMVSHLNVGIGINVNNDPTGHEPHSCSLAGLTGRTWRRIDLVTCFLDRLEEDILLANMDRIVSEWKTLSSTPGKPVRIVMHDRIMEGIAQDIDETGALILKLPDGTLQPILFGDCFEGT